MGVRVDSSSKGRSRSNAARPGTCATSAAMVGQAAAAETASPRRQFAFQEAQCPRDHLLLRFLRHRRVAARWNSATLSAT
jgi:activator of HSP90 ATPase